MRPTSICYSHRISTRKRKGWVRALVDRVPGTRIGAFYYRPSIRFNERREGKGRIGAFTSSINGFQREREGKGDGDGDEGRGSNLTFFRIAFQRVGEGDEDKEVPKTGDGDGDEGAVKTLDSLAETETVVPYELLLTLWWCPLPVELCWVALDQPLLAHFLSGTEEISVAQEEFFRFALVTAREKRGQRGRQCDSDSSIRNLPPCGAWHAPVRRSSLKGAAAGRLGREGGRQDSRNAGEVKPDAPVRRSSLKGAAAGRPGREGGRQDREMAGEFNFDAPFHCLLARVFAYVTVETTSGLDFTRKKRRLDDAVAGEAPSNRLF